MVPGIEVLYREGLVFIYNGLASVACEYLVVTLTVLGDSRLGRALVLSALES